MSDPTDTVLKQIERLNRRALFWMIWERYAAPLAPAAFMTALFVLGAWLGVWQWLGDPFRLIALLLTLGALYVSAQRCRQVNFPTPRDIQRRLERDSEQSHRPLETITDRPARKEMAAQKEMATLWAAHQARALAQIEQIKPITPRPTLAPIDPHNLRFILPACLAVSAVYMAGFSFERLRSAVMPYWQSPVRASAIDYEAWIDPPAYTGLPPIYFTQESAHEAPKGSEFVLRLSGAKNPPRPRKSRGWTSHFLPLSALGGTSYQTRTAIETDTKIEWYIGQKRHIWNVKTTPDLPPEIEIAAPPKTDERDRLVLSYHARDDYGIKSIELEITPLTPDMDGLINEAGDEADDEAGDKTDDKADDEAGDKTDDKADDEAGDKTDDKADDKAGTDDADLFSRETEHIPLPLSGQPTDIKDAVSALDMSKHIWAGRKVVGRLIATDGNGQSHASKLAWFTVPNKIFVEPLAKAVIEQRGLILSARGEDYAPSPARGPQDGYWNEFLPRQHLDRAPKTVQRANTLIEAVTDEPAQIFKDPAVYLGLAHARSQLRHADEMEALQSLPEDLWRIALRAEFGVLGTALEEMREAEAALRNGIARHASKREIATLFERYNRAVEAYTEALRRQAIEEGNVAEGGGGGGAGGGTNSDEIKRLLKAIEEANAAGDTQGARRALAQLAEALENMKMQLTKGSGEGGDGDGGEGMSEEMKKNLEELADLTGEQRALQDDTRQSQTQDENQDQGQGEMSPQELAQRQAELQDRLEALGGTLSEGEDATASGSKSGSQTDNTDAASALAEKLKNGLKTSQDAMAKAQEALTQGQLGEAGEQQAKAIAGLRQAGAALAEAALSEDQKSASSDKDGKDPLGRSEAGLNDGDNQADIEDRDNATRARELLEELRRRAAEQAREDAEREYLKRLLERF